MLSRKQDSSIEALYHPAPEIVALNLLVTFFKCRRSHSDTDNNDVNKTNDNYSVYVGNSHHHIAIIIMWTWKQAKEIVLKIKIKKNIKLFFFYGLWFIGYFFYSGWGALGIHNFKK